MKISRLLIDHINDEGRLEELAFFLYLKGLHSNSTIINYSQDSLGARCGKGRGFGRARGSFILKNKWGVIDKCGHLRLIKVNLIKVFKKRMYINIPIVGKTLKEIYNSLLIQVIKHKSEQAIWYKKTCCDLRNFGGKKLHVLKRRLFKKYPNFRERDFDGAGTKGFKISFSKLSGWLGFSVGKTHKLIKELEKEGLIQVHRWYKRLKGGSEAIVHNPNSFMSKHRIAIKVACNQYSFL